MAFFKSFISAGAVPIALDEVEYISLDTAPIGLVQKNQSEKLRIKNDIN